MIASFIVIILKIFLSLALKTSYKYSKLSRSKNLFSWKYTVTHSNENLIFAKLQNEKY
jgi:hypothetical protein